MTALQRLISAIISQQPEGVESGDWPKLKAVVSKDADHADRVTVELEDLEFGFVFDSEGRLIGAYNWKQ